MNPEQHPASVSERTSAGCLRIAQSRPALIQFAGKRMTWGFAWSLLNYLVLRANPDCHDPQAEPAQELGFHFPAAQVTMLGWQLDLLLEPIASQSIACIRTEKSEPAKHDGKHPVIAEIFVLPSDYDVLAEYSSAESPAISQPERP
jgi:hypothetical protein